MTDENPVSRETPERPPEALLLRLIQSHRESRVVLDRTAERVESPVVTELLAAAARDRRRFIDGLGAFVEERPSAVPAAPLERRRRVPLTAGGGDASPALVAVHRQERVVERFYRRVIRGVSDQALLDLLHAQLAELIAFRNRIRDLLFARFDEREGRPPARYRAREVTT